MAKIYRQILEVLLPHIIYLDGGKCVYLCLMYGIELNCVKSPEFCCVGLPLVL
jgi:hypothetical protein